MARPSYGIRRGVSFEPKMYCMIQATGTICMPVMAYWYHSKAHCWKCEWYRQYDDILPGSSEP